MEDGMEIRRWLGLLVIDHKPSSQFGERHFLKEIMQSDRVRHPLISTRTSRETLTHVTLAHEHRPVHIHTQKKY